ncbi:MAG: PAS domain S-box protein [Anaerolineae bacterium]|nr:PAS domain S-box protein [Anaerolineae bacterium]
MVGVRANEVFSPEIISQFRNFYEGKEEIIFGPEFSPKHYELRFSPLVEKSSKRKARINHGRVVIIQDTTERKLAEQKLKASEERYKQLVENATDIIYRTDPKGRFSYANPTAIRLMGFSNEFEVIGKSYLDLAHPDWRNDLRHFYRKQFIQRTPNTYKEFQAYTQDGKIVWLGQNVQILTEGKEIIGFQAVARDLTEQKLAEEALAIQTANLTGLYQLSQESSSLLELDQVYAAIHRGVALLMPFDTFTSLWWMKKDKKFCSPTCLTGESSGPRKPSPLKRLPVSRDACFGTGPQY